VKKEIKKNIPLRNDTYIANEKDKLFWYFFILKYGFFEYELVANKTFIREKEEKIKLIEQIREKKKEIKNIKCKINFLEGELLDNDNISIQTFLCCCFINNIDVILKKNRCIYHIKQECGDESLYETDNMDVIEFTDLGYGLNMNKENKPEIIKKYLDECYIIKNINKPINAVSSYKLTELQDICKKLNLSCKMEDGRKYKKNELYDIIKSKI
jgi:hypothetical protein